MHINKFNDIIFCVIAIFPLRFFFFSFHEFTSTHTYTWLQLYILFLHMHYWFFMDVIPQFWTSYRYYYVYNFSFSALTTNINNWKFDSVANIIAITSLIENTFILAIYLWYGNWLNLCVWTVISCFNATVTINNHCFICNKF